jgi:hypothetical protein
MLARACLYAYARAYVRMRACAHVWWRISLTPIRTHLVFILQVIRERDAMALVNNPFCVRLFYSFRSATSMILVMEYVYFHVVPSRCLHTPAIDRIR